MKIHFVKSLSTAFGLAVMVACGGNDSTSPHSTIAGNYTAFQWVTTGGSGQTNQLTAGSTLQITLNDNGSTTGHMHTAASNGAPAADFDLSGTWDLNGNLVQFTQAADTFLNDMVFSATLVGTGVVDLVGNQNFSGTQIQLTLRRSP